MSDKLTAAIGRRLDPVEKTALVAGFKSTHDGAGLTPKQMYEELLSREADRN